MAVTTIQAHGYLLDNSGFLERCFWILASFLTDARSLIQEPFAQRFGSAYRFGHSSDFTQLFVNDQTADDYIRGALFACCLTFALAVLWFLMLLVFRLLGPRRVGCMCGGPMRRVVDRQEAVGYLETTYSGESIALMEQKGLSGDRDILRFYHEEVSFLKRPTMMRLAFLLSGTVFILFSVLAVTKGLTNLQLTLNTVHHNSAVIREMAHEAEGILTAIRESRTMAVSVRDELVKELSDNNFCPANEAVTESDQASQVINQAEQAIPLLNQLNDFVSSNMAEMESSLDEVQQTTSALEEKTDRIDFTSWRGMMILVPYTLIPAALMAGTILAMYDIHIPLYSKFLDYFACPLMILLVLFACCMCSLMLVAVTVNSDFCYPVDSSGERFGETPDTTILRILKVEGYTNATMQHQVVNYYVSQCEVESAVDDPFAKLREYQPRMVC